MSILTLIKEGFYYVGGWLNWFSGGAYLVAFYLLCLIGVVLLGRNREKTVFAGSFLVLALTAFNPPLALWLTGKLGLHSVYYRFFWILPVTLLLGLGCVWLMEQAQGRRQQCFLAAALVLLICYAGTPVIRQMPGIPDNQYKVPDDLLAVCTLIHEDSEKEFPKAVFENDYNLLVRQYDGHMRLTLDRDLVLLSRGEYYTTVRDLPEEEIANENVILQVVDQLNMGVWEKDFRRALDETDTDYLVISRNSPIRAYLTLAELVPWAETESSVIYRVPEGSL